MDFGHRNRPMRNFPESSPAFNWAALGTAFNTDPSDPSSDPSDPSSDPAPQMWRKFRGDPWLFRSSFLRSTHFLWSLTHFRWSLPVMIYFHVIYFHSLWFVMSTEVDSVSKFVMSTQSSKLPWPLVLAHAELLFCASEDQHCASAKNFQFWKCVQIFENQNCSNFKLIIFIFEN